MEIAVHSKYRIGEWVVSPDAGEMSQGDTVVRIEVRMLRLLSCLAAHAGEVVSIDSLLDEAWQGVVVTPDSVYQAVTALRRLLGDDPKQPRYIETIPRRGYRLVAKVERVLADIEPPTAPDRAEPLRMPPPLQPAGTRQLRTLLPAAVLVLLLSGLIAIPVVRNQFTDRAEAAAAIPRIAQPIAVMPFLDLTDEMTEEPFADGMVEEVIGKLSKYPSLKVAPPASSFFYKEKQISLPEFARQLHVRYVLDGSVRKSGATLRVAARLTRADDGFVVWSESYDRNWSDKLKVQDDIAESVAKALAATLH